MGFADFRRDLDPAIAGMPEAGWVLASWAHGRGLASEAVAGALAWFDREERHREAMCLVHVGHAASVRLAAKNGFVRKLTVTVGSSHTDVMVRRR